VAHIYFLIEFRHRLVVALNWIWSYFTYARGARLITGATGNNLDDVAADRGEAPVMAPDVPAEHIASVMLPAPPDG